MALSLRMLEVTLCMRIRIDLRFAATVDEAVLLATIMILSVQIESTLGLEFPI